MPRGASARRAMRAARRTPASRDASCAAARSSPSPPAPSPTASARSRSAQHEHRVQDDPAAGALSYVLLEDGTRFDGEACGAEGPVTGEVVFNTAMSGYQESMTDPSYARQLITFTYPHIGNYGVSAAAMESDRIHARGAIMRDARNHADHAGSEGGWLDWLRDCGVPAITGVDTRALVRHIREAGSMR